MKTSLVITLALIAFIVSTFIAGRVAAHCDTLDGPVVETAKLALAKGDVTPVLKWVNKDGEKEVREAFAAALKVRSLGPDAQRLADTHFFETLVRVHRAGEGVPFTGLKPAGTIDPAFVAADKALHDGAIEELAADIARSVKAGLHRRFLEVLESKKHANNSIEAGRAHVAAYVEFAHYVEALHAITSREPEERHHLHQR
jgi:squalene cyclase